jgi:hypothetical protein
MAAHTVRAASGELWKRLPEACHGYVAVLLGELPIDVRVTRPRRTKLGDHRGPRPDRPRHAITVNEDLNPYAFLTTFLHEVAHATTWERHQKRIRRIRPHGIEWKAEYGRILAPVVAAGMLPGDVTAALERSIRNPAAATCSDRGLAIVLARYDTVTPGRATVESLPAGTLFRTDSGRCFILGPRLRSRYRCVEQGTGREYRMHPLLRVAPVDT